MKKSNFRIKDVRGGFYGYHCKLVAYCLVERENIQRMKNYINRQLKKYGEDCCIRRTTVKTTEDGNLVKFFTNVPYLLFYCSMPNKENLAEPQPIEIVERNK